ncbi:MAG: hypothetical protein LBP87_13865 [Planctomycetaceae bacterium]|jgi:hypothetical protein|nr:hypothetical protein [Planctomycetaceae bacterium]
MMTILNSPKYNNVFESAKQLSPEEQSLLIEELNRLKNRHEIIELVELFWSDKSILTPEERTKTKLRRKQLEAELTPEKIQTQKIAWEKFLKMKIGEEEIKTMEENRKELNQCRLAFL